MQIELVTTPMLQQGGRVPGGLRPRQDEPPGCESHPPGNGTQGREGGEKWTRRRRVDLWGCSQREKPKLQEREKKAGKQRILIVKDFITNKFSKGTT